MTLIAPGDRERTLKKYEGDQRQADRPSSKLLGFPCTRQTCLPPHFAASRLERQMRRQLQKSVAADGLLDHSEVAGIAARQNRARSEIARIWAETGIQSEVAVRRIKTRVVAMLGLCTVEPPVNSQPL